MVLLGLFVLLRAQKSYWIQEKSKITSVDSVLTCTDDVATESVFDSVDAHTRRVVAVKAMVHGIRGSHDQMHCCRRTVAPSECWLVESRVIGVG